jgi:hypothetical protein
MLQGWVIASASFAYLGVLFAIAYYGDKRADAGRSVIANPTIYALSLAVYCTTWTFYGSVGRAASTGIGFLPIYLGPTLMAGLWWFVMLKIIRISKANRITSIADFVSSRYGKSQLLGGLVTIIAVIGIVPYISLQLKAVSNSFTILLHYPEIVMPAGRGAAAVAGQRALHRPDPGRLHHPLRHPPPGCHRAPRGHGGGHRLRVPGQAAGLRRRRRLRHLRHLQRLRRHFRPCRAGAEAEGADDGGDTGASYGSWWSLTFLSMLSIMFLPRQFQIAVVENVNERHLARAIWLFPAIPAHDQHLRAADRRRRHCCISRTAAWMPTPSC